MFDQLVDRLFRLATTHAFRDVARIRRHRDDVDVRTKAKAGHESNVERDISPECPWKDVKDIADANPEEASSEDAR